MALFRLRRTLTLSSSLLRISSSSSSPSSISHFISSSQSRNPNFKSPNLSPHHSRSFRSTPINSVRSYNNNNSDDTISPDTILFEGCDYNHWLITMEFPKHPKPTPEEMVETYVQTLAKVVGSVEEAKKRMYACSTTTYQGFQAEMTEEMSEKFKGLPGVVFILPDSYIDPVNKEYGGDKYINGTIIPRPPPVQYGRSGGRFGDRNRNFDRSSVPNQQGNQAYNSRGPTQGDGRNYGPPQQNAPPPQQNYGGQMGQGERRDPVPMNNSDYAPGGRGTFQGIQNQGQQGNYYPPPDQRDYRGVNRNYSAPPPPPAGSPQGGGAPGQGGGGSGFGQHYQGQQGGGGYGFGQNYQGQQGGGYGYGQNYQGQGDGQSFSQGQGDGQRFQQGQGEQRNYPPPGHTGTDQGRY